MDVTRTLLVDLIPVISALEAHAGEYLLPDVEGFFLPFQLEPVLKLSEKYFLHKPEGRLEIQRIDDIDADVFDRHGNLVLQYKYLKQLKGKPFLAARSVKLVKACVEYLIQRHARWMHPKRTASCVVDMRPVIARFVYPQYAENLEILESIEDYLLNLRSEVTEFLGEDEWIMFFQKLHYGTLIVERTIDYRIMAWMREHSDELE